MTIVIRELVGEDYTGGQGGSATIPYQIEAATATQAEQTALIYSPVLFGTLRRQRPRVHEVGDGLYEVEVPYSTRDADDQLDIGWSFEIGTSNLHITQALEHVGTYPADSDCQHKGAIGVRRDGNSVSVDGCDVHIPVFTWEEKHYLPYETVVSYAFLETMEQTVATMNRDGWRIWGPGELLLLGVSGAKQGEGPPGLTFRFASSRTKRSLRYQTTGTDWITVPEKKGWDYLWIEYTPEINSSALTSVPQAVHVERVYDYSDFSTNLALLGDPWRS